MARVMVIETFRTDPRAFYDVALPFLTQTEAENNLIIGMSSRLATGEPADSADSSFWVVRDGGEICGVAMWTPPHDLVLSHPFSSAALGTLSECLLHMQVTLPGVLGPDYAVREFAARWTTAGNLTAALWLRERIYQLQRVEPLHLAPGRMICADEKHVAALTPWVDGFIREMGEEGDAARILNASVAGRTLFLWSDGRPVSMAAWTGPTPNGVRINMVYTPPEKRRRGYATAVVSTLSSMLLGQGRSFCALYADLSNQASNSIYRRIGYQPALDCYHYRFTS